VSVIEEGRRERKGKTKSRQARTRKKKVRTQRFCAETKVRLERRRRAGKRERVEITLPRALMLLGRHDAGRTPTKKKKEEGRR
jgi:hypothetical protein